MSGTMRAYRVTIERNKKPPLVSLLVDEPDQMTVLSRRLQAVQEQGLIEDFQIETIQIPHISNVAAIVSEISRDNGISFAAVEAFHRAWDHGWRNRDPYFNEGAKRHFVS